MRGSPLLFSVQGWVWPCCRETLIPNCAPWEQMVCFLFTKSSQWWAPAAAWPGMENLFGATCPQEGRRQADWVGELQPPSCQSHPLAGWALTCKGTYCTAQGKHESSLCPHPYVPHRSNSRQYTIYALYMPDTYTTQPHTCHTHTHTLHNNHSHPQTMYTWMHICDYTHYTHCIYSTTHTHHPHSTLVIYIHATYTCIHTPHRYSPHNSHVH